MTPLNNGPPLWTSYLTMKRRSHSFDNFINLEQLDTEVWPRKCRSLCDKRWNQEMKNDLVNGSSSEYDSSDCESEFSVASAASFDRLMDRDNQIGTNEIIDKDMEMIQPYNPERFDMPMRAPGDLQTFRRFHQWVPSSFDDSQLPKDIYCRPTPTYVWKARRRKFQKRKNLTKKRFEILELASDIDTDDDCQEEQIESALDSLHQKGGNIPMNNHLKKVNWLNQTLYPLKQRKCSSDENSASDSEEACKYNAYSGVKNVDNCSSEEDTCDVDRDSDYEYFHVWGESDSGHSDLNVAEDVDVTAGSSFLENIPKKKKASHRRKIAHDYDAPSPEPFLPDANEPYEPIPCAHKISACDTLVTGLINLGISNPSADMPHFLCIPPCNVVEKPFDFVNESVNFPPSTETPPDETSAVCKRKLPKSPDAGECTPGKLVRFADNSSRPSLLLSPSNSDPMSISSLNSDNEATLSEVISSNYEQNQLKHSLDVKLICNESSPFHTPVSEMDCTSPPLIL